MSKDLFDITDNYESYYPIKDDLAIARLAPNGEYEMTFDIAGDMSSKIVTLQLRGEVAIPRYYREEPKYPVLYRRIGDSLEDGELVARGSGEDIARGLYYKVWTGEIKGGHDFTLHLEYLLDGSLTSQDVKIEVFYKGDGTRTIDSGEGDIIKTLELASGTEWQKTSVKFKALAEVDFMFISILTDGLDGVFKLKAPTLINSSGENILLPFAVEPLDIVTPRWVGENYSKLEWAPFEITLNGEKVWSGEKFDRIFAMPAFEFPVDSKILLPKGNVLVIKYPQKYSGQLDFNLRDIKLITKANQGILAGARRAKLGVLPLLIRVAKDDSKVSYTSNIGGISPKVKSERLNSGINVVAFEVKEPFEGGGELTIDIDGAKYVHKITRYIIKTDDVITGSGDSIYVNLNKQDIEEFFAWYFANGLGNAMTFRTTYRWSGSRNTTQDFWHETAELLSALGVRYSLMIDGRELNSNKTNGQGFDKDAPLFDGYQTHEQDGAYYYWRAQPRSEQEVFFNELCGRRLSKQGMLPNGSVVRENDNYYVHYSPNTAKDMKDANRIMVENFKRAVANSTRHTGPSILFKYMAEAGMEWLGAELLYGTMDLVISALRGVSKAMGKTSYGGHLAIQWSTTPHENIGKYRRFLQSLLLCYMKGCDQINTEEGFYRVEERRAECERDSKACRNLTVIQKHFTEFVETHTRRGDIKVNMGLIQGKYDSVNLFTTMNVYGQQGNDWAYSAPEKSWDIARKVFYPKSKGRCVYRHPCPNHGVGFFTDTPYGEVDIVPIEADLDKLSKYPYLAMVGWNTADEEMADKLYDYVAQGGTLLLALPHLYTTVTRSQALQHISNVLLNDKVKQLLGVSDIKRNNDITLTTGAPSGVEFGEPSNDIIVNKVGKGSVYFVNRYKYPSKMKSTYRALLKHFATLARDTDSARGKVDIRKSLATTSVFDSEDRRVIYMLDVKWWRVNEPHERVTLHIGAKDYDVTLKRDCLNICTCFGEVGVVTRDWQTDIISLVEGKLTLQGEGDTSILILKDGDVKEVKVSLCGVKIMDI